MKRVKAFVIADLPQDIAQEFMQYIRDFDTTHKDCHFEIGADAPDASVPEITEILKLNPELKFQDFFLKPKVHILQYGLPLCRFTSKVPYEWPEGHKWVGLGETKDVPNLCK